MKIKELNLLIILILFVLPTFQSCIEPVDAEYDLQAGIIFIDGYALTEKGLSSITISESALIFENYTLVNVLNAQVEIQNVNTEEIITFAEDASGVYQCPSDFAAEPGEVWKMFVRLENGKKIESKAQTVVEAVPMGELNVNYASDIVFSSDFGRFIPGHSVNIDLQDPVGDDNYYMWKYRTFEPLIVCETCIRAILRNGICQPTGQMYGPPYYNYLCDPQCWQIRYGSELPIYDDRLEDGASLLDKEVAIIPYYRKQDILVEVQQYSLDESAYEYFKIISNQVSESGGLNAPPPAALLGNLFNPDDSTDLILGQFTSAGVSTKSIYIERTLINDMPVTPDDPIIIEGCLTCPTLFPCEESVFRTAIKPDGWP